MIVHAFIYVYLSGRLVYNFPYLKEHTMKNELMRQMLFESLNNAVENGYELREWSAADIAEDFGDDPLFKNVEAEALIPLIEEWLAK